MNKLYILLLISFYMHAKNKTVKIYNKSDIAIQISVMDSANKSYTGAIPCGGALTWDIDLPTQSWADWIAGRSHIKNITINKESLIPSDEKSSEKIIHDLISAGDEITIYVHKRPSPETWGDWAKNLIKEKLEVYTGTTPPQPQYKLQFIKDNRTNK